MTAAAQCKIYGLVDPRTNAVRYVGKTENTLGRRLRGHIQRKTRPCACKAWVDELLSLGLRPLIVLLELVPEGVFWAAREVYWIAKYRATGPGLLNKTDGGSGQCGRHTTAEMREKYRVLGKARFEDPEYRRRAKETLDAYRATPGMREAQAERMRAQLNDPIKGKAHKAALKLALQSPEFRAKRSAAAKAMWADPASRAKLMATINDPAVRAARSERVRSQWADKEIREKMVRGLRSQVRAAKT